MSGKQQDLRGRIFEAITGRKADVSGRPDGDVLGMLRAVGGTSRRTRSGIDLTAAAERLGTTRRTVERWVKAVEEGKGQRPSGENAAKLAKKAQQAATTKAGRKAALSDAGAKMPRGATVRFVGWQGPINSGGSYMRARSTELDLDPAATQEMLTAWQERGDKGFMDWATNRWDQEYLDGWSFGQIDQLDITTPERGHR